MPVGIQPTKNDIDNRLGMLSLQTNQVFTQWQLFKQHLDDMTDEQLEALAYSPADIADIRAATNDVGLMTGIFAGVATLAEPHDFRLSIKKFWGVGF